MKLQQAVKRKAAIGYSDTECLIAQNTPTQKIIMNGTQKTSKGRCLICESSSASEPLHEASTLQVDTRVCNYSHVLLNEQPLAKPSAGDLIAQNAK